MITEIIKSFLFAIVAYGILAIPAIFLIKEPHILKIGKKQK